jgi:hypothetical protein
MEFAEEMPGCAGKRPAHVVACVKRSPSIIQLERDLNINAVIAVQTDALLSSLESMFWQQPLTGSVSTPGSSLLR